MSSNTGDESLVQSAFLPENSYTVPELMELLSLSPGRVHRLLEDHVLAGRKVDGVLRVPHLFVQDGAPLPTLRGTILVLLDAGFSEEGAIDWLLTDNDELGRTPIASLRAGHKSAVRRATQALAF